jgi:ABC-type bacteriocin/lantibiotic exporter with double-glycine peptidase domain
MKDRLEYYKLSFSMIKPYKKHYLALLSIKVFFMLLQYITPLIYLVLVNDVMGKLQLQKLYFVIGAYLIIFAINTGLGIASKYIYNHIFNLLNLKLQCKLLKQFINTNYENTKNLDVGDLKNRILSDIGMVGKFLTTYSSDIVLGIIFSIVVIIIMFFLSYILAFCVLLVIPLSLIFSNILGKKSAALSDMHRKKYGEYEGQLYDTLNNWKEVKTNAIEEIMLNRIQNNWDELAKLLLRMQIISFFARVFSRFKDFFLTQMSLYFIGGLLILNGHLTIGILVAFMNYFMQLLGKTSEITDFIFNIKTDAPIAKRLFEVFSWPSASGRINKIDHEDIELVNVIFNYPDAESENNVLNNVSMALAEKEYVSLVGESGCGKSTLAKLLMRLYTPNEGVIRVGGAIYLILQMIVFITPSI